VAQLFHRSTNALSRLSIFGTLFAVAMLALGWGGVIRSSYVTEDDVVREQPIPFSHQHHVGGLGLDCRYCHTSVERSPFAGVPPTQICMNCHKEVWSQSATLDPVRASFRENRPIEWIRVNDVADFVYFDHSIHIHQGVGCETCHGRVDRMPLTAKAESLSMEWCLNCHRNPGEFLRPREEVFTMGYRPAIAQAELGSRLVEAYRVAAPSKLIDCSVCHR
jgi:hypothetical protein